MNLLETLQLPLFLALLGSCATNGHPRSTPEPRVEYDELSWRNGPSVEAGPFVFWALDRPHHFVIRENECSGGRPGFAHPVQFIYPEMTIRTEPCEPPFATGRNVSAFVYAESRSAAGVQWSLFRGFEQDPPLSAIEPGQMLIYRCTENPEPGRFCGLIRGMTAEGHPYSGGCRIERICDVSVSAYGFSAEIYYDFAHLNQAARIVGGMIAYLKAAVDRGAPARLLYPRYRPGE
jgi:hypothetical protein